MSLSRIAAILFMLVAGHALPASAQDVNRPVVLVMESSLGITGATRVRETLRQRLGIHIGSATEVGVRDGPRAILAVALDRARTVTVIYVDERGQVDSLSAPAMTASPDVTTIVATLAGALLQKHLADSARDAHGDGEPRRARARAADAQLSHASRALRAAVACVDGLPRCHARLSTEEF